jgi:predicted nucleic acid-binding protein
VIAYFDTSAIVPLLIAEPGSGRAQRAWNEADRVASVRLLYPEARAVLAQAHRLDRITANQLTSCRRSLDQLMPDLDHVELTSAVAQRAGDLAEQFALRGYDSVHLAAAETLRDPDLVLVGGDHQLRDAALTLGINVIVTES